MKQLWLFDLCAVYKRSLGVTKENSSLHIVNHLITTVCFNAFAGFFTESNDNASKRGYITDVLRVTKTRERLIKESIAQDCLITSLMMVRNPNIRFKVQL